MTDLATYDALLLDHAVGALTPAASLVVATHLVMSKAARRPALLMEALGAALLETLPPSAVHSQPLIPGRMDAGESLDAGQPFVQARALIDAAKRAPDSLAWRWRWFGVSECRLPVASAFLLRIAPRSAAPRHDHIGDELTLVLSGAFEDENGFYEAGDLVIGAAGAAHRPRTRADRGCVCLVASGENGSASRLRVH